MAVNKVIYSGEMLLDLTSDTVTADTLLVGYTAHSASGSSITGTYDPSEHDDDEIDRILTAGLTDGYKHFSDDGTIISTTDSEGRVLTKTFSDDFKTCTTVLTDLSGSVLGKTIKNISDDGSTITTTDSKGQTLVKIFSDDNVTMTAVLTDSSNAVLASMTKTYDGDDQTVTSVVTYGS